MQKYKPTIHKPISTSLIRWYVDTNDQIVVHLEEEPIGPWDNGNGCALVDLYVKAYLRGYDNGLKAGKYSTQLEIRQALGI